MDYTKRLFEYFREDERRHHLIIAPNAPPIEKTLSGLALAIDAIFDNTDISETLIGLQTFGEGSASRGDSRQSEADPVSATFCLSIKDIGRFRVSYLTQRGSKAMSMERIPFIIPSCESLKLEPTAVERLLKVLRYPKGGIVAVFGPSTEANSKFVYSLLNRINNQDRCIMVIQERELTHLMRHDNSIVLQRELGSDFENMDVGIQEGLDMMPHIMFVGDLLLSDKLPSLVRAVETHASVVLSVVATDRESFIHILKSIFGEQYAILGRRTREIVSVTPQIDGGLVATFATKPEPSSAA